MLYFFLILLFIGIATLIKFFQLSFSVSNEVPDQPVVSPLSGAVFERRLLEKYIAENGTDPINNKELRVEQLIDLKGMLLNIDHFGF